MIQLKCQNSNEIKAELDQIKKKDYFNELSENYEQNLV